MILVEAEGLLKALRRAREQLAKSVVDAVRRAAELTVVDAKGTTSFVDRTGQLRSSIRPVFVSTSEAHAVATAKHAAWVERGNGFRTGARYIYPKNGPFLVFELDGRKIVTPRVRTSKPRRFMEDARKKIAPRFLEMCREAVRNAFNFQ